MADWQGNGGTTGSSDICNVSPSDQIGTIDNILNRLQALEAALAGLLGTNVEAAQLSDISNDLGWIFNVEYLGTDGWTQTPAGTLIPPSGWTGLSDLITLGQTTLYSGGSVPGANSVLHRYSTNCSSTLTSGSNRVLQINGTMSASSDISYNGTDIFDSSSTDDLGNTNVWEILVDGVYDIEMYFTVSDVAPITSGSVRVYLAERRASTYRSLNTEYVSSHNGAWLDDTRSVKCTRLLNAGRWLDVIIYNFTDGSIAFGDFELIGTLKRAT